MKTKVFVLSIGLILMPICVFAEGFKMDTSNPVVFISKEKEKRAQLDNEAAIRVLIARREQAVRQEVQKAAERAAQIEQAKKVTPAK